MRDAAGAYVGCFYLYPLGRRTELSEEILGVTVRKVIIPVAAGRNLAVLVEAAVRNEILKLRGIDTTAEFVARQKQQMQDKE